MQRLQDNVTYGSLVEVRHHMIRRLVKSIRSDIFGQINDYRDTPIDLAQVARCVLARTQIGHQGMNNNGVVLVIAHCINGITM
ncbi:MAG: hypothetical protein KJ065_20070 [Anaerolineae bacterium]|nr:hypothetical protein [Anaerolineae bacterium]